MQVIVEMLAATAVLREATTHACMALAVVADATNVVAVIVGQKDVAAEIDRLSEAFEASSDPGQVREIMHGVVDRNEDIGVFWDGLAVASEPIRTIRNTPEMLRASRSNASKATSSGRRAPL